MQLKSKETVVKEHELIEKKTALTDLKHEQALKKNKVLKREKAKKSLRSGQSVEVTSFGQRGTLVEKFPSKNGLFKWALLR